MIILIQAVLSLAMLEITCLFMYYVLWAVSREWIDKSYKNVNELIKKNPDEFKEATNFLVFHDAVESVARIWLFTYCRLWLICHLLRPGKKIAKER